MNLYSVANAENHVSVRLEWDEWTAPESERVLGLVASGAAMAHRPGVPMGGTAIHGYTYNGRALAAHEDTSTANGVEVWVEVCDYA